MGHPRLEVMNESFPLNTIATRIVWKSDATLIRADRLDSKASAAENGTRLSPPTLASDFEMDRESSLKIRDDTGPKSDSEAETIVLTGKDGNSQPKFHKSIRYDERSRPEYSKNAGKFQILNGARKEGVLGYSGYRKKEAAPSTGKRKRSRYMDKRINLHRKSRGLKSAPISPMTTPQPPKSKSAASDSEISRSSSPRSRSLSLIQDGTRLPKSSFTKESDLDNLKLVNGDNKVQQFVMQQSLSRNHKSNRDFHFHFKSNTNNDEKVQESLRSTQFNYSGHKRSFSHQLPAKSSRNFYHNKKRVPPHFLLTEYNSDNSSASGASRSLSSQMRGIGSSVPRDLESYVRIVPSKKHVNCSGQTPLAVACSRGKLELVKKRYYERPQDINVADNALNTPLHIASLKGRTDIVKFLLETSSCELDCINSVKDTPLHDAIDNRNINVVRLLLNAGANPSKPNQAGNDPLDLLNQQDFVEEKEVTEKIHAMKEAVIIAKKKFTMDGQRKSDSILRADKNFSDGPNVKNDPGQGPSIQNYESQDIGFMNKKNGTARSLVKTTESVLYQTFDLDALRIAARDGDIATASRVLDIRPGLSDAKTLYNAAKGGHDAVINLLFALGDFEPDPKPLDNLPPEYSTPILAAIGKDNHLEVIKLFLGNPRFNPARRIRGEMYFEIAARRAGSNWQEEVMILKKAHEAHQNIKNLNGEMAWSSGYRRGKRASDLDFRKNASCESSHMTRKQMYRSGSISRDWGSNRTRHRKKSSANQYKNWSSKGKKSLGMGKSGRENEPEFAHSDPEDSISVLKSQKSQFRKPTAESTVMSEHEPVTKPRPKLISRKMLNYEREMEKQKCVSNSITTSITSWDLNKERSDRIQSDTKYVKSGEEFCPIDEKLCQGSYNLYNTENESKHYKHDIAERENFQFEKRNGLKNHFSFKQIQGSANKYRSSEILSNIESLDLSAATHVLEKNLKEKKNDNEKPRSHRSDVGYSITEKPSTLTSKTVLENTSGMHIKDQTLQNNEPRMVKLSESSSYPKDPGNCDRSSVNHSSTDSVSIPSNNSSPINKNISDHNAMLQDTDESPKSPPNKLGQNEEENFDYVHIKIEKQTFDTVKQNDSEDCKESQHNEKKFQKKSAFENGFRGEEEKSQFMQEFPQEKQPTQDTEVPKRARDVQIQRYREQERLKREEQDRRRATVLEQQRVERIRIEEAQREKQLSKLPLLLKWFNQTPEPKTTEIAKLFSYIVGYRYDTINTKAMGKHGGDDQWMLNTHAAILLGEKDLQLSRYTTWERISLTIAQKRSVWNSCNGTFLLLDGSLSCLRSQLPFDPQPMHEVIERNRKQFLELELFFVKVVEFMYVVPNFPHLRGIEMAVLYRELHVPQCVSSFSSPQAKIKWHQDTPFNPTHNLVPSPRYYTNGAPINRTLNSITRVLRTPPAPDTYPRRMGLTRVYPWDSDYEEICKNHNFGKIKASSVPLKNLPQSYEIPNMIPDI